MGRNTASYLRLQKNLWSDSGEIRFLRLPRLNPFPKLDRTAAVGPAAGQTGARQAGPVMSGTIIDAGTPLPEMAGDMIDTSTSYAVSNVKRGDTRHSVPWTKVGFALFKEKLLGGHRAARL